MRIGCKVPHIVYHKSKGRIRYGRKVYRYVEVARPVIHTVSRLCPSPCDGYHTGVPLRLIITVIYNILIIKHIALLRLRCEEIDVGAGHHIPVVINGVKLYAHTAQPALLVNDIRTEIAFWVGRAVYVSPQFQNHIIFVRT